MANVKACLVQDSRSSKNYDHTLIAPIRHNRFQQLRSFGTWRNFISDENPLGFHRPKDAEKRCLAGKTMLCFPPKIRLESKGWSTFDRKNPLEIGLNAPRKELNHLPTIHFQAFFLLFVSGRRWNVKIKSMDMLLGPIVVLASTVVSSLESMGIQPYLFITQLERNRLPFFAEPTHKKQTCFLHHGNLSGFFSPPSPPSQEKSPTLIGEFFFNSKDGSLDTSWTTKLRLQKLLSMVAESSRCPKNTGFPSTENSWHPFFWIVFSDVGPVGG